MDKLVDSDESRYSVESLRGWRRIAEAMALGEIEQRREFTAEATPKFMKAEQLMRGLLTALALSGGSVGVLGYV